MIHRIDFKYGSGFLICKSSWMEINSFIHHIEKWSNVLQKSCGMNTGRFFKFAWPFFSVMNEWIDDGDF